ncbi:hypothetical protein PSHT_00146 [Puccinia striiformis]|uniref:Uncharacterized protein n=2 Tax=Puccinia striiformis TaxID=27350 RepID=A0A2S4VZ52_9BASI|nr:hypothetical protein PSTT_02605 [Puccinia striiformis]POW23500.1 hypothetical protein PSHT_00146 [Puccinia striiformis]
MPFNNIPSLSSDITSPINSINRRQRSNTSPAQSLSALNGVHIHDAPFPHPPAPIIDHYYERPQLMQEGGWPDKHKPEAQPLDSTEGNPVTSLSASSSLHPRSLKREANSPVYLDRNTISLASSNNNSYFLSNESNSYLTRRVVQCNSDRIRSSDSDVTSISSQDENLNFKQQSSKYKIVFCSLFNANAGVFQDKVLISFILCCVPFYLGKLGNDPKIVNIKSRKKTLGQRNKWTHEETQALVRGCNKWKAIRDSEPELSKRSPGDLKDRFRTYFPDAYRKHYPNAKTHISSRVRSVDSNGNPLFGESAIRRERKQFSVEEDAALKRGYVQFGTAWSSIQKDPVLANRKATDLRDRFRNAFPEIYAAAGYKPRSRKASGSNVLDFLSDPNQQHGTFEAIDLSVYPPHPCRVMSHMHPTQYPLPSLDFLKAHGADAFSDFGIRLSNHQMPLREDLIPLDDPQLLVAPMSPAVPAHLTNMTPRPNITPRPNDTTPRPRKALTGTTAEELDAASVGSSEQAFLSLGPLPAKPPKSLHKTHSSMDLTQFSNLHLVDSSFNPATVPHHIRADLYSPTSTDYLDYGVLPTGPCSDTQFLQSVASKLSLRPGGSHGESGGDFEMVDSPILGHFEHDFNTGAALSDAEHWLRELDAASQTFPSGFDFSGFTNQNNFESPDGGSCGSSLISSDPSKDPMDDRVVYTGDGNKFHQSPPDCHSFTSQQSLSQPQPQLQPMSMTSPQLRELFLNSHYNEKNHNSSHEIMNQESRTDMDSSNFHAHQLEQPAHLYQHRHAQPMISEHSNQIASCPSLLASDLNPPMPCSPKSPISTSSAIRPSSSTSSASLISSPMSTQLDLLLNM